MSNADKTSFEHIQKNNLNSLKDLINICATEHKKSCVQNAEENFLMKKLEIEEIFNVLQRDGEEPFDKKLCGQKVRKLNNIFNELTKCPVLVSSIFPEKSLQISSGCKENLVTPAYDVLKIIFANSDQQFRQKHFHDLAKEYYDEFSKNNESLIKDIFNEREYKVHITFLLPFIKLETLINYRLEEKDSKELIEDFRLYVKHPRFHREDVFKVVENKIGSTDYDLNSYTLEPLDEQNGHLGHYFYLNININFRGKKTMFRLFLKYINQENDVVQKLIYGASLNEAFFYEQLIPEFQKLGLQDLLTFAPKCYLSRASDLLVMDDMISLGFKQLDHYTILSYHGLKAIAIQLARYHTCSFILEDFLSKSHGRRVELDELYHKYFEELIFVPTGPPRQSFESFWDSVEYLIDLFQEEIQYDIPVTKFKEIAGNIVKETFFKKLLEKSPKFRNCICHGDLYASNTVLKDDQNGVTEQACLLDFQTMRYLPPAHDLLLLIYINTDKKTRDKFLDQIIQDYYEEFAKSCEKHNIDASGIYTESQFLESVEYMKSQALNHAFMYSHALKVPKELKKNLFGGENHVYYLILHRTKLVQRAMSLSDSFRDTQKDYIRDLHEICSKI